MTTAQLLNRFYKTEYSFLVNVIVNHHSNPYKKLKGLANLVDAGHWAALPTDLDHLVIDGESAPWSHLEDWSKR